MKRISVDARRLSGVLSGRLGLGALTVTPIGVQCAWPVFKATAGGRAPMFVKVTERASAERTLAFLAAAAVPFLPRPAIDGIVDFDGHAVLCLEWKSAACVNAEDMTDAQLDSFAEGCRTLSGVLAAYRGPVIPLAEEDSPRAEYDKLRRYAERHPLASRMLRPLLSIPEGERTYGDRPLVTIHGDFQPLNYGFDGDRFAAVFDTDNPTQGLACEDAAYAFTESVKRLGFRPARRRRAVELFRRMVGLSPWPADEWRIAVSHARLRIAARRIARHPDSALVAFDIYVRDRPLQCLADALRGL